ncbi:MCE family protein [Mycolicibacterium holsaticum]|uniref:MCE family protein n=1 Tax=Mycolicibacterium holsaticum TaxID=152142 RepID=UPI001C7D1622|nr:MCE family protein [Mycolicibacterium holsaticum]QZA12358.1 MCE family protein [Mycolicibacterium holsaticum DSM 44478 = JCM 12374]UNC10156.1 MCE family protein [Mycolicibacterium holsaticum DSM 44478 = JCM 12374]
MTRSATLGRIAARSLLAISIAMLPACSEFQGLNSVKLPGTKGGGPGSFTIQAQLPDVQNLERNSRVRVDDVTVGNVAKTEVQGWHALVTLTLDGDVDLPANATATIGQTSLLGSAHIELAPPTDVPPEGKLREGALIPLSSAGAHPSTEETLAAVAMVLNGGGVGHVQDIVTALSTAVTGRENDLKSLIEQSDTFVGHLDDQKDDIVSATDSLNSLVGQFAEQRPVIDKALETVPQALTVLKDEREVLADAAAQGGKLSALVTETVEQTKENLVKELHDLGPVLKSLADAGPSLTRSLDLLSTLPFPKPTLEKWIRGDYANLTAVVDLTLSRIDASLFTGTRWEGDLTELELQWGRTIGQMPSPYTAANPLVAPYRFDQGP